MNLIVDIGNSRVKIAVMKLSNVVWSSVCDSFTSDDVTSLLLKYKITQAIVCSTRGEEATQAVAQMLREVIKRVVVFDRSTPIPIKNSYSTPETLGRDRLAAAVGARILSKADNQLIIDMGTAITIDLVTAEGGFEGGVISPGVGMRFRALHEFTASLPKCAPTERVVEIARSTTDAIEQGVMRGVEYELRGYIDRIEKKYDKIDIIFTGGDAKYFDKQIKNAIFAPSELIFVGLNRILEYNAKR